MILLISTCQDPLSEYEFVNPIIDILKENKIPYNTINYKKLTQKEINKATKIIITGTALKDFQYIKDINIFIILKEYNKPILGICAGFHILGLINKEELSNHKQIGQFKTKIIIPNSLTNQKEFNSYFLHSKSINKLKSFTTLATSNNHPVIIKHNTLPYYATLFHPEVLNKEIVENFCKLISQN